MNLVDLDNIFLRWLRPKLKAEGAIKINKTWKNLYAIAYYNILWTLQFKSAKDYRKNY